MSTCVINARVDKSRLVSRIFANVIRWEKTVVYTSLNRRRQLLGFAFPPFNITFFWLQHRCWRHTACQFVFSYTIKLGTMFATWNIPLEYVQMINKIYSFKAKWLTIILRRAELTAISHDLDNFPLQITARSILGRGAGTIPLIRYLPLINRSGFRLHRYMCIAAIYS